MNVSLCLASRDDELLTAVARGDHDAFAELYDRFAPHVFARATNQIGDSRAADAAVMSVFVEFWRQAPRLDRSKANVTVWMFNTPFVVEPVSGRAAPR